MDDSCLPINQVKTFKSITVSCLRINFSDIESKSTCFGCFLPLRNNPKFLFKLHQSFQFVFKSKSIMRGSHVRRFVAKKVAIHLPFFDAWSHWIRSKLVRSDLASLLLISGFIVWFRYTDIAFANFYQFLFMSFKLEDVNEAPATSNNSTSIFYDSLIEHLPNQISTTLIKHSTATISFVYVILFAAFYYSRRQFINYDT